ncbi:hypothetical protein ABN028_35000 [Actinopolymorpha sp. B17G11]|uniref:hypothetical protein n=1 Tax=Actinopolymorpha sp. B17G11 TaxID=3160861 RepID=UPI0032E4301E
MGSCLDCLAWGANRNNGWRCEACRGWQKLYKQGGCPSCRRVLPLGADGFCRLCWRQAAGKRPHGNGPSVLEANRHGQQLFLADTFRQKRRSCRHPPMPATAVTRVGVFPVAYEQLVLFPAGHGLHTFEVSRFAVPRVPELASLLDRACFEHAAAHGWTKTRRNDARAGIRILLACQDTPGAAIRASEAGMLAQVDVNIQPVLEVLAGAGMLDDDRPRSLDVWFANHLEGLPEPMASEVRTWYEVLRDGSATSPRSLPRSRTTTQIRIRCAIPVLHGWAAEGHRSLREITRDDIKAALPALGSPRALVGQALKSLFRVSKARRVVFVNPTTHIRTGRPETRQPLPMNLAIVKDSMNCDQPVRAALAALLAFHAPRPGQLRTLHLTDIHDGRLYLPSHTVLLAEPVKQRLTAWLDHRAARWPNTANPHLFINTRTAGRLGQVSGGWINHILGVSAQTVREDRILDEAIATDGDTRRLCDLFGLSIKAAERYTNTLDHARLGRVT